MKLVKRKEKGEGNLTCSAPPGFFTSVNKTKRRRRVPDLYDPPWDLLINQWTIKMDNIVAQKRVRWWERERERERGCFSAASWAEKRGFWRQKGKKANCVKKKETEESRTAQWQRDSCFFSSLFRCSGYLG